MINTASTSDPQGSIKVENSSDLKVPRGALEIMLDILVQNVPGQTCLFFFAPRRGAREWVDDEDSFEFDDYLDHCARLEWVRMFVAQERFMKMYGSIHVKLRKGKHETQHLISGRMSYGVFCKFNRILQGVPQDWDDHVENFWRITNRKMQEVLRSRVPFKMMADIPPNKEVLAAMRRKSEHMASATNV